MEKSILWWLIYPPWWLYCHINPIIQFVIRPVLRLVDAHNHPLRGGIAASFVSILSHYVLVCILYWTESGLLTTISSLSSKVHWLIAYVGFSNFMIGISRYLMGSYGDKPKRTETS